MRQQLYLIWWNYVARHFWYHYFNWRYPALPRVRGAKVTRKMVEWAKRANR